MEKAKKISSVERENCFDDEKLILQSEPLPRIWPLKAFWYQEVTRYGQGLQTHGPSVEVEQSPRI